MMQAHLEFRAILFMLRIYTLQSHYPTKNTPIKRPFYFFSDGNRRPLLSTMCDSKISALRFN